MSRIVYDPEWRNDPVRRAAVKAQIEARQAVFAKAQALVEEAAMMLYRLGPVDDDAILDRCVKKVGLAHVQMKGDADSVMKEPNDTYIGNRAASGSPVGWTPTLADFHNALADECPTSTDKDA
jgi:hypothetical protein